MFPFLKKCVTAKDQPGCIVKVAMKRKKIKIQHQKTQCRKVLGNKKL